MIDANDPFASFVTPEMERERARNDAGLDAQLRARAAAIRNTSQKPSKPRPSDNQPAGSHDPDDYALFCTDRSARLRELDRRVDVEIEYLYETDSRIRTWGLGAQQRAELIARVSDAFLADLRTYLNTHPSVRWSEH